MLASKIVRNKITQIDSTFKQVKNDLSVRLTEKHLMTIRYELADRVSIFFRITRCKSLGMEKIIKL